ncbi:MAG: hypothetical protein JO019_00080 [Candidatus Kaiserbacteria bacterium]|nr:hypothetical protein [Candidatus Kaiserbacteria bacterium]
MRQPLKLPGLVGGEVETWACEMSNGILVPRDVTPLIDTLKQANGIPILGTLTRESGIGSIEFASTPVTTIWELVDQVYHFQRRCTEEGIDVRYTCAMPYGVHEQPDTLQVSGSKSRFAAIVEASKRETAKLGRPDDWRLLLQQNNYAATHLHRSFDGMRIARHAVDIRLIYAANVMRFVAPRVARILCDKHNVDNRGHLQIFKGWGDPRRFAQPDVWHRSFAHMQDWYAQIPRFICSIDGDQEKGQWQVDLERPTIWARDDLGDVGFWHLCRIRTKQGTLEFRLLPAMSPEHLRSALTDLDDFVCFLVSIASAEGCNVESVEAFKKTDDWKKITDFPIGGAAKIPANYDQLAWTADFMH